MPLRRSDQLNRLYFLTLLLSDSIIVALSIILAVQLRFGSLTSAGAPISAMAGTWIFLMVSEVLAMMVEDLYAVRTTVNRAMNIFRTIRMIAAISILFIVVLFLTHFPTEALVCSRLSVLYIMMFWMGMTVFTRLMIMPGLFALLLRALRFKKITISVFGEESIGNKIVSALLKSRAYGEVLELKLHSEPLNLDPDERLKHCIGIMETDQASELMMIFDEENFDEIARFSMLTRLALIPFGIYSRRIPELGYFDPWMTVGNYGSLTFCSREWTAVSRFLWRITDIILALFGLLIFLPVIIVTVPLIAFSSPGGVLYRQTRIGLGKESFSFYKFRSMRTDVKDRQSTHKQYFKKYVNGNAASKSKDGKVFKTINFNALTPTGKIIRKTSIDELPQIINVLRGEMSIVGPRPCIDYELEHYTREWLQQRFTVKPGLTGIWQVYGRSRLSFEKSQFLDFIYVISRTDGLNIRLILKTLPVMLFGKGGM